LFIFTLNAANVIGGVLGPGSLLLSTICDFLSGSFLFFNGGSN